MKTSLPPADSVVCLPGNRHPSKPGQYWIYFGRTLEPAEVGTLFTELRQIDGVTSVALRWVGEDGPETHRGDWVGLTVDDDAQVRDILYAIKRRVKPRLYYTAVLGFVNNPEVETNTLVLIRDYVDGEWLNGLLEALQHHPEVLTSIITRGAELYFEVAQTTIDNPQWLIELLEAHGVRVEMVHNAFARHATAFTPYPPSRQQV